MSEIDAYPLVQSGPDDAKVVTATQVNIGASQDKVALDTYIRGGSIGVTTSGLEIAGKVTEVALNSATWTALPATALANRNAICIQNPTGIEIKINYDNSVVGYVGVIIGPSGERYYDITDSIVIYAKSASGTPTVNVEELS